MTWTIINGIISSPKYSLWLSAAYTTLVQLTKPTEPNATFGNTVTEINIHNTNNYLPFAIFGPFPTATTPLQMLFTQHTINNSKNNSIDTKSIANTAILVHLLFPLDNSLWSLLLVVPLPLMLLILFWTRSRNRLGVYSESICWLVGSRYGYCLISIIKLCNLPFYICT